MEKAMGLYYREDHCSFAILNNRGRCVAICHRNSFTVDNDSDCVGNRSASAEEHMAEVRANQKRGY